MKRREIFNTQGQNALEYIILFAIITVTVLYAVAPKLNGFVTKKTAESLDLSIEGLECMAAKVCYDPDGCPAVCGDTCCQSEMGESATTCPQDCRSYTCVRDPALPMCTLSCGEEGCEVYWRRDRWGHMIPFCSSIPCTGTTQVECESQSHCVWQ